MLSAAHVQCTFCECTCNSYALLFSNRHTKPQLLMQTQHRRPKVRGNTSYQVWLQIFIFVTITLESHHQANAIMLTYFHCYGQTRSDIIHTDIKRWTELYNTIFLLSLIARNLPLRNMEKHLVQRVWHIWNRYQITRGRSINIYQFCPCIYIHSHMQSAYIFYTWIDSCVGRVEICQCNLWVKL